MITRFWHSSFSVDNLERAIEQYRVLGFKVIDKFEKPKPHAFAALMEHSNGSGIEIWQWLDKSHPQVEFIQKHLAFISNDQDNDVQKLVDLGWTIVIPKTKGVVVTYVFLRDPSGNYVEIADVKE